MNAAKIDDQLISWLDKNADSRTLRVPMEIELGIGRQSSSIVSADTRIAVKLDTTALSMTLRDHLRPHCKSPGPCRVWVEATWGPLIGEAAEPTLTVRKVVGPVEADSEHVHLE